MSNDKILLLARKLKALAEKGTGGEKDNASQMLSNFMQKHNLSLTDIEGEKKTEREFKYKNKDQFRFLKQVLVSVTGYDVKAWAYRGIKNSYFAELTDLEYVEISLKYQFFWKEYLKQMDTFYRAFIQTNGLYAKEKEEEREGRVYTEEELEQMREIMRLSNGMKKAEFHKQIEQ
jgi:hypothetical protein